MILTGQSRKDFLEYYDNSTAKVLLNYIEFDDLPLTCQNAFIINWFDSVGLKIIIIPTIFVDDWKCDIFAYTECFFDNLQSRQEALNVAIAKANEIYNTSFFSCY